MRILVTGGTGLVGQALQEVARNEFPHLELIPISSKDGDLTCAAQVESIMRKHAPLDGVIHLAANVGGLFKNMRYPVEMLQDNLLMNTHVLATAHKLDIQNVVCILSTCIFPDKPPSFPITMEMLHEGPPHPSNQGYAYAKRLMETACRAYQTQYGRRYFCVVPTNVYGPHDNFHLEDAHVIPALIHKCWIAKKEGAPLSVCGDGSPIRQFIYSYDLARILLRAYESYQSIDAPLIACPPSAELSIREVVQCICDAFGGDIPVEFDHSSSNGQKKKTADTTALERFLPHMSFTSLKDGISHTVSWFQDNTQKNNVRM